MHFVIRVPFEIIDNRIHPSTTGEVDCAIATAVDERLGMGRVEFLLVDASRAICRYR